MPITQAHTVSDFNGKSGPPFSCIRGKSQLAAGVVLIDLPVAFNNPALPPTMLVNYAAQGFVAANAGYLTSELSDADTLRLRSSNAADANFVEWGIFW